MAGKEKYLVIVAGGKGLRMGAATPKQFLPLCGKPLLFYSINAFRIVFPDIKIIMVLPAEHISYAQIVLSSFSQSIDVHIVSGGPTRFHSVQNGLKSVNDGAIVFVHDGVRPLVSPVLVKRCYEQAIEKGSAIPAIPVKDSIRILGEEGSEPIDRELLRVIQTPQTFRSEILLPAFELEYAPAFTDEATVVEASGVQVHLIEGERGNIKVTTPDDMVIAEVLMKNYMQIQ
jgi:2-C-methyl-D-erythritol 4-phosphate cytidylyltransferase